jgi:adenosylcobinamide-GDP ribazoletransferase
MKDSRIGAYAAIALIFAFGFRFLSYGAAALSPWHVIAVFAAAHCVGRAGMVWIVWSLDYARAAAEAKVPPLIGTATASGIATVALCLALSAIPAALVFGALPIIIGLIIAMTATLALRGLYRRKLGGWTGDTAGATQVIAEIGFVLGATAWI